MTTNEDSGACEVHEGDLYSKMGTMTLEDERRAPAAEWSDWSDYKWDEHGQQWYCTRTNAEGEVEHHWYPSETSGESTSEIYAIENFYPENLCSAFKYYGETLTSSGFLQWVPAEGISAAVLSHHLIYHSLYKESKTRAKAACQRLRCSTKTKHFDLEWASIILYVYGREKCFLINSSGGIVSDKELLAVKRHSISYARRQRVNLENITLAEFVTAAWIDGEVPRYNIPFRADKDVGEYAGGIVCDECGCWTPYGVRCLSNNCLLPTLDENFSARGTLGAKAIEAMMGKVGTEGLHPGEDAAFGFGGMAVMAVIGIFVLGGAFRGA